MKSKTILTVASVALLSSVLTTPVLAAAHKPAKMTCEEFLAVDDVAKPKIVYWAEGFNKQGKPVDAVVDIERTDKLIPVLVEECKATPKKTLWQKIKSHF